MNIGWPEGIYLALIGLATLGTILLHDKPRPNYDGKLATIGLFITLSLLYWGGFFD